MTYADAIHEALYQAVYGHEWAEVVMAGRAGGAAGFARTTGSPDPTLKPAGIVIDMATAAFATDARHGRALRVDRTDWIWDVLVKFDRHVSFEELEIALESPILITREASGLPRQVIVTMQDATYSSPARQQSTSGSKAQFRFSATLSPL